MVPVPHDSSSTGGAVVGYVCPHCGKELDMNAQSMTCIGCGYVPRHGAD